MTRQVRIAGRSVRLPVFAATASLDEDSWFWRYGVDAEALLLSYDVVIKDPDLRRGPLRDTLDYRGLLIVDSGAFGVLGPVLPRVLYATQRRLKADIAVALDRPVPANVPSAAQWRMVRETVANAELLRAGSRWGRLRTEAPVQGRTPEQRAWCAEALVAAGYRVIGVPVSSMSRGRQYVDAATRVLEVRAHLPAGTVLHALGCGSRTMMAVLAGLGVELFDSSSWFRLARHGEMVAPVTACHLGVGPACPACAQPAPALPGLVPGTVPFAAAHNLTEILREVARIRLAQDAGTMAAYLRSRVPAPTMLKLAALGL